jgi:riboflavin transporter FmnP
VKRLKSDKPASKSRIRLESLANGKVRKEGDKMVKKIALCGVFIALAVVVEFIHFPIFPAAPFLEYDAAGIILLVLTFFVGKTFGGISCILTAGLHVIIGGGNSGVYGFLMNAIALLVFVFFAKLAFEICKKILGDIPSFVISAIMGMLVTTAVIIPMNLIFTPLFMGAPFAVVKGMLIFPIIPFNLIKWGINGFIGVALVKALWKTKLLRVAESKI